MYPKLDNDVEASPRRDFWRLITPDSHEAIALLLLLLATSYQLFLEPVVGIANNADFLRLIGPAGLGYKTSADYWGTVFKFAETKFYPVEPTPFRYLTSQRLVLYAARPLNALFSKDGAFDTRAMGVCNLLLYLVAVAVFLRAFRAKTKLVRFFVSFAVLLVFADLRLVGYFNTFYSESASLIFMVFTVAFALLCTKERANSKATWGCWIGYMFSATLFWTAKSQNTAVVPCLAIAAWFLFPASNLRLARSMGAAVMPLCVLWAFAAHAWADTTRVNVSVVLNEEIIPNSKSPEADKQELDVPRGGPTFSSIARFYARHPSRWWKMAKRRAKEAFSYIPFGSFARAAGFPAETQSQAFNTWSEFKKAHFPRNLVVLIILMSGSFSLLVTKAFWFDQTSHARRATLVGPILLIGCVFAFIVAVTFEANGTAKHLFVFNVGVDLCLILGIVSLFDVAQRVLRARAAT